MWRLILLALVLSCAPAGQVEAQDGDPTQGPWSWHTISDYGDGADGNETADLNGDGLPDIVTPWEQSHDVAVHYHPGLDAVTDSWPTEQVRTYVPGAEGAQIGDLDKDGDLDIASFAESANVDAFLDTEGGTWALADFGATSARDLNGVIADVNGDSWDDIVSTAETKHVDWWENPGGNFADGSQWTRHDIGDLRHVMWQYVEDVDGDGDLDLIASARRTADSLPPRGIHWFENDGTDGWPRTAIHTPGDQGMMGDAADFDGDGDTDMVVAYKSSNALRLYERTGATSWAAHDVPLASSFDGDANMWLQAAAFGDINEDGQLDIVVTVPKHSHSVWWVHVGDPWSGPYDWHSIDPSGWGAKLDNPILVDIDAGGEGDLDVVVTEQNTGRGAVWFENPLRN